MQETGAAGTMERTEPLPGARLTLVLLLLINLINYIDRYVLAAVLPSLKHDFFAADDKNAEFWLGALSFAFLVTYMIAAPVFGWLADRMSRWLLIGVGVLIWSLASGASGLAQVYAVLFLTRCLVGFGEASYGPVAPTVIADCYPIAHRGKVLAWFYMAIPVGSALGYLLGSLISGHFDGILGQQGWRWAFYLVMPPGLLLAAWCFWMREPKKGQLELAERPARRARLSDYLILLKTPSYVLNTLGMTAMTFAIGGMAWWMPYYLETYRGQPESATKIFGGIIVVAGLTATLLGGIAGDKLRSRYSGSYFLVSGSAMLIGFPFSIAFLYAPFPLAWLFIFLATFFLFFNTGPTNTILANVTHPSIRATGYAVNIFVIHAFGDAISPAIIGFISDRANMNLGFMLVSLMILVGGVLWLWGAHYLERDMQLATARFEEAAGERGASAP